MGKDELKRLSKNDLVRIVLDLYADVQDLKAALAKAGKNSSTSSKPPSSEIVKPPKSKPKKGKKRKIGGQPGHERHVRKAFDPEDIDFTILYPPSGCPDCGGALVDTDHEPRVVEQVEVIRRPIRVTRHEAPW